MFKPYFKILAFLTSLLLSFNCMGTCVNEISEDQQKLIIEQISQKLLAEYVDPMLAAAAVKYLKSNMKQNAYLGYDERSLFVNKLTNELQKVTNDQHIRVKYNQTEFSLVSNKNNSNAFNKVEILAGNVGLIKFDEFSSNPKIKKTIDRLFSQLSDVDALIIDLRNNRGGSPDLVRYISSYFFSGSTHLNSIYWRDKNRTDEYWTLVDLPEPKRPDLPLYILTSSTTFSAAEEFAYNLKVRKRAYLVGEPTKGGANPGHTVKLPLEFSIFIPTGKAINPITLTNWEGVGVAPDLPVIAVKALEEAHAMAKYAAIKYRIAKNKATPEEKFSIKPNIKNYGQWKLAKNGCPLKYRWAQPEYNDKTQKYQFPYQVKYYGNGSANIEYQLGNSSGKMKHILFFNNRNDVKTGVSIGFTTFDKVSMSRCRILSI